MARWALEVCLALQAQPDDEAELASEEPLGHLDHLVTPEHRELEACLVPTDQWDPRDQLETEVLMDLQAPRGSRETKVLLDSLDCRANVAHLEDRVPLESRVLLDSEVNLELMARTETSDHRVFRVYLVQLVPLVTRV